MRFWNLPTLLIFWLLLTIFLGRFFMLSQAIYGDGIYYWAYMRSIVIDHDIDLRNEAVHNYSPEGNNREEEPSPDSKGLEHNKYYPVGPSVMWSPAFLLAHMLSRPLSLPQNGFADHYQIAVGVLNISYIVIGLTLIFRLLLKRYSQFVSFIVTVLILFATNLLYYGSIDILNSHPSSFFVSSVLITLLFKLKENLSVRLMFLSGALLGLLALIRPQDILFGVLFVPFFFEKMFTIRWNTLIIFTLGGFLTYLPQLIVSLLLFNNFLALPYLTSDSTFEPTKPHFWELFLSTTQGLLFYSPLYLVGIAGLYIYAKKRLFGKRFLVLLFLEIFLISIWSGWSQGEAFGIRMVISLLPIFAFGIAEVLTFFSSKLSKVAIVYICLLFVLQNFVMILAFHLFFHEPTFINGELSEGGKIRQMILERISPYVSS